MLFNEDFLITQCRLMLGVSFIAVKILRESRSNKVNGVKGNYTCFQSLRGSSDSRSIDTFILPNITNGTGPTHFTSGFRLIHKINNNFSTRFIHQQIHIY